MARAFPDHLFVKLPERPTVEDFQDPVKRAAMIERTRREIAENAMPQVRALWAAGWQMEVPSESATEPWQWAWRRPPRRKNSKGQRYASTNQAYQAMLRQQGDAV